MKKWLILLLPLLLVGCFRAEVQTADFRVPGLDSKAKALFIEKNLKQMPGVLSVEAQLDKKNVQVTYTDTVIRKMNIEQRIAAMGFDVNYRQAVRTKENPNGGR